MKLARLPVLAVATVVGLATSLARAQDAGVAPAPSATVGASAPASQPAEHEHPSLLDRPHTVLNLEAGIIALPNAAISPSNRGGSTPIGTVGNGDATMQTGVHILYRATGDWAIGAGALFAPLPTSETTSSGASGLSRTHSRSYFTLAAEARYYPFRSRWFEGWFGLTVGGVVVGDRFVNNNAPQVPSILGNNETTVSSEGFAVGVQVGADYLITNSWVLGLAIRADRWILPSEQPFGQTTSCDPVGDCPTLTGSVAAFEFGLTVGYRIPL